MRRHILKVKFISLVNLIANREVVKELVADTMTVGNMQSELKKLIEDQEYKDRMLAEYEYMADRLGPAGAPQHAARKMLELLKNNFLFLNKRKAGAVNARLFYLYSRRIKKRGINMKKFNWLLVMLLLALVPALQSCDDDGYSIGDIGWDWATVRATGGGGYYLEGDRWGMIDPVASSIPWYKPVDGERVVAFSILWLIRIRVLR